MQPINPMMMGMMGVGGGGMMGGTGGGGGLMGGGAGMNMNPLMLAYLQQLYLEILLSQNEDPDDTGVWDGEDEEGADVLAKMRRRRGRRGGESHSYSPFTPYPARTRPPPYLVIAPLAYPPFFLPKSLPLPLRRPGRARRRPRIPHPRRRRLRLVLASAASLLSRRV